MSAQKHRIEPGNAPGDTNNQEVKRGMLCRHLQS